MSASPLLLVSGEYPPDVGGVADYTCLLQGALTEAGWPSRVLSRASVRRWDVRALPAMLRAAPRGRGIVHVQFQAAAFDLLGDVCLMPALLHRVRPRLKVVTTFHDTRVPYLFPKAGRLRERAVQLLARTSDAVIAADARDLAVLGGPSPRHLQVPIGSNVQCAPPPQYDRGAFRAQQLGAADDHLVVAYFGLRNATKGLDLLIDAFHQVAEARPKSRLLLLGGEVGASDPTNVPIAARLRQTQRVDERVMHTGWLSTPELSSYLLAADVAVLPYTDGASGRRGSLLACAEHGLPIVSTTPAAPDVADAVLAVRADAQALADAILGVASDPALHARLRAAARTLASAHAWSVIAVAHANLYASLHA